MKLLSQPSINKSKGPCRRKPHPCQRIARHLHAMSWWVWVRDTPWVAKANMSTPWLSHRYPLGLLRPPRNYPQKSSCTNYVELVCECSRFLGRVLQGVGPYLEVLGTWQLLTTGLITSLPVPPSSLIQVTPMISPATGSY